MLSVIANIFYQCEEASPGPGSVGSEKKYAFRQVATPSCFEMDLRQYTYGQLG